MMKSNRSIKIILAIVLFIVVAFFWKYSIQLIAWALVVYFTLRIAFKILLFLLPLLLFLAALFILIN